jgi:hypothetical protein
MVFFNLPVHNCTPGLNAIVMMVPFYASHLFNYFLLLLTNAFHGFHLIKCFLCPCRLIQRIDHILTKSICYYVDYIESFSSCLHSIKYTSCTHLLRPRKAHPFHPHLGSYTKTLLVSQDRRHLFVTPWVTQKSDSSMKTQ